MSLKKTIFAALALAAALAAGAQTYVGTMTIGDYTQRGVEVTLTQKQGGSASALMHRVKFARMMPVRLDVELKPLRLADGRLAADSLVPTAGNKSYEKFTVRRLAGTSDASALRFKCRMGKKELAFDGKKK